MPEGKIPAIYFVGTIMANVDNEKMSDANFRQFIRDTLSIVEKPDFRKIANKDTQVRVKKYYGMT